MNTRLVNSLQQVIDATNAARTDSTLHVGQTEDERAASRSQITEAANQAWWRTAA